MGFEVGAAQSKGRKKGQHRPEMNVTPLVDVVLVLLIIFMVLTASQNDMFWVHVPEDDKKEEQPPDDPEETDPNKLPLVVSVNAQGRIKINQDVYADREFPERLRRMLVARGDRRIYFDAERGVAFERVMAVMDAARGAGAAHIAVVTEQLTP
jgi:biopolymer transport protein ExbD/biopolymer transport protein TolR